MEKTKIEITKKLMDRVLDDMFCVGVSMCGGCEINEDGEPIVDTKKMNFSTNFARSIVANMFEDIQDQYGIEFIIRENENEEELVLN